MLQFLMFSTHIFTLAILYDFCVTCDLVTYTTSAPALLDHNTSFGVLYGFSLA